MTWRRWNILVEGQTERNFVANVLNPFLATRGIAASPRVIQTSRDESRGRRFKGGFVNYEHLKRDLTTWLREDQHSEARFTTMIDLYKLPKNFPGQDQNPPTDPYKRVKHFEEYFAKDMEDYRLHPYISLHEFETLLLVDPENIIAAFPNQEKQLEELNKNLSSFAGHSPELIDEGEQTAPSKRIIQFFPDYEDRKAVAGHIIAGRIGIDKMTASCPHFKTWIETLLASPA